MKDTAGYLEFLAEQLVHELEPAAALKKLTSNPDLLGAYTEATVRRLVARISFPLHVCSGSVTDVATSVGGEDLPELDTIIWAPSPAPAIFTVGDFGIVPRSSSFGILEIKRSAYTDACSRLAERLQANFVRKYVADFAGSDFPALGVVCVRLAGQSLNSGNELIEAKRLVVLFEESGEGWKARPQDIWRLVNFLTQIRARANQNLGTQLVRDELLGNA